MATLKQRLHRKNNAGTYDTIHYETSSDVVMRPSGRTVEQDLAAYLPEVQNNDNVPESLTHGKFSIGSNKAFVGLSTPETLITSKDNPLIYDENGKLPPYDEVSSIPSGIIVMWSGSSDAIPDGWHLCDGTNNTPDLRDKFIIGAGSEYQPGNVGGDKTKTLSTNNLPSHSHSFSGSANSGGSHNHTATLNLSGLTATSAGSHTHTATLDLSKLKTSSAGNHSHEYTAPATGVGGSGYGDMTSSTIDNTSSSGAHTHSISGTGSVSIQSSGAHTHTISGSGSATIASGGSHTHTLSGNIGNTGNGEAFDIMPPYYALCFIMKL